MNELFSNLEEGIVQIKDETLDFTNQIFIDIMKKNGVITSEHPEVTDELLNEKIFIHYKNISDQNFYSQSSNLR